MKKVNTDFQKKFRIFENDLRISEFALEKDFIVTDAHHYRWLQKRIRAQLALATTQTQCSRTANTCANLVKMWPALWTFAHNPLVPPTNNAAEQALPVG